MRPADKRPRRAIGLRCHAARVHNHHVGRFRICLGEPGNAQPLAHCFAIRSRGPAAKIFYVKSRHESSLKLSGSVQSLFPNLSTLRAFHQERTEERGRLLNRFLRGRFKGSNLIDDRKLKPHRES
jgi:hypothetical protein